MLEEILLHKRYTCKGKGGRYVINSVATGAGTSREHGEVVVYFSVETGKMFYRTRQDKTLWNEWRSLNDGRLL